MAKVRVSALIACALLLMLAVGAYGAKTVKPPKAPKTPKVKNPKTVSCHGQKKLYPYCAGVKFKCPAACPHSCNVDCLRCRPVCPCDKPGGVCQDPRFIGGDGITFYFHGKKDQDFCLLSDSGLHINGHFIGKRDPTMTRDFTWVQSVALLFGHHRLHIYARKTTTWDDAIDRLSISYDGDTIDLPTVEGATWQSSSDSSPTTSIVRSSSDTNEVTVEVEGQFRITATVVPITEEESRIHNYGITSGDCYAHLELGFKFYSLTDEVDGVLGQTYKEGYASRVNVSAAMPVMGGATKFFSSNIYATDCPVSKFGQGGGVGTEKAEVKCASGLAGSGIVCKK